MVKQVFLLSVIFVILITVPIASGQVFEKATFQESATILYDQKFSNSIIASIGFETTSNEEIRFSDELIEKIISNEKIRAVVFTNAGECVIGVTAEEQCIMVNFDYLELKGDAGIRQVQDSARAMGNEMIDDLNETFNTKTKFHSTFIHTVDDANILLETSGVISGRGAVSATFTMEKQSTDYLFADLAGSLIPKNIRDGGGFFDVAKTLAKNDDSIISISMIRNDDGPNLFIFKITNERKDAAQDISKINLLNDLQVNEISRSNIFDKRNVPLNSVIQLVVIPIEQSKIDAISTHIITDLTKLENISKKGWFFSSPAGDIIDAKFLFGVDKIANADELRVEIGPWDGQKEISLYSVEEITEVEEFETIEEFGKDNTESTDEQYVILGIIIAVGTGAAIFYLKGYRSKN